MESNAPAAYPLGYFSCLALSVGALFRSASPSAIADRLLAERHAQIAAGQICASIKIKDPEQQDSALEAAWASYGQAAFERAMSSRSWGVDDKLTTPAIACCRLKSAKWFASLGALIPREGWNQTLDAGSATISIGNDALSDRDISIANISPLHVLCCNSVLMGQEALGIASDWFDRPAPADELACRALLSHDRSHLERFDSFIERIELQNSTPSTRATRQRSSSL